MEQEHEAASDRRLVELCLLGNRNAFAQIIARYQSVICAIAYSMCGDIGRSEDLAQDTFIAAWKRLGELREPEKLKSWLCGIARNLTNNFARQQQRTPTAMAGPLPPESCSGGATPHEEAISKEEETLMWRALEMIPEIYREPMILFYRENQSTQAVAATLEISEEAVRQRLARGRVMLTERVEKTVEMALIKSAPGKAFTLAVLAALPSFTTSAKAGALGTTAAKGSAMVKGVGLGGLFQAVLTIVSSVTIPFFALYFQYKTDMDDTRTPEARPFIRRCYLILFVGIALFMAAMLLLIMLGKSLAHSHPALYAGLWIGMAVDYVIFTLIFAVVLRRRRRTAAGAQAFPSHEPLFEYRSKFSLLGLPLVHIRLRAGLPRGPVKAWFAAGDAAIGVIFAFGAIAVAPISFGGFAVGLLPFGGFAIGLLSLGAFSLGPWAVGVFAIGWQACGMCAIGWLAAYGDTVAVAHGFAQGGVALAAHGNDTAAASFFKNSDFFQNVLAAGTSPYFALINFFWLFPLVMWRMVLKKKRRVGKAPVA